MKITNIIQKINGLRKLNKNNLVITEIKVHRDIKALTSTIKQFFIFGALITLYLVNAVVMNRLIKLLPIPAPLITKIQIKFSKFYINIAKRLENNLAFSISKLELIHLALRNMQVKKARSYITIGGVALGIGAIVFLVSIGYGLKGMVLGRVARLEELKQADVSVQPRSKIKITDKTLSDTQTLPNVVAVYPVIAVVGRINYQNSISDMAVYGVTTGYLKNSSINTVKGNLFDSETVSLLIDENKQSDDVAGEADERISGIYGEPVSRVEFSINPGLWIRVRSGPSSDDELLGYTQRSPGQQDGTIVWGSSYDSDDNSGSAGVDSEGVPLGKWVNSNFQIYYEESCDTSAPDCYSGKYMAKRDLSGNIVYAQGYTAVMNVNISKTVEVLGISSDSANNNLLAQYIGDTETAASTAPGGIYAVSDDNNSDWVIVPEESAQSEESPLRQVSLSSRALKKAVVNKAMLRLINLTEEEAIGKKFSVSFVIPSTLVDNSKERVESAPSEYEIVGVTADDTSPIFYVPFVDLRSLGISNYSQYKVIATNENALPRIRELVSAMGYNTSSVQDTVAQINSFFDTVVLILGSMGMIALAIASLGMFNTLTVSLLERTREVGLMKAMGMKTDEVKQLFLIESIIMGFSSGLLGLILGYLGGKILSIILSVISLTKGQGFINISHVPFGFVILILFLSMMVGLFTGIFPAQRSGKISALNALRYE